MPDPRYGIIVNTWKNISLGALHYYAHAWREEETENGPKVQKEQALYALNTAQAETMNLADGLFDRHHGNPYREGDLSWRFEDQRTAVGAALAQILRWTGGVRVPVGIGEPYTTPSPTNGSTGTITSAWNSFPPPASHHPKPRSTPASRYTPTSNHRSTGRMYLLAGKTRKDADPTALPFRNLKTERTGHEGPAIPPRP